MHSNNNSNSQAPTCVGTGLITLDLVVSEEISTPFFVSAGGSCGNVMAILAYLGWESVPVARLENDGSSVQIINDLESFNVETSFIERDTTGSTPVIVEHLSRTANGGSNHRYRRKCPFCDSRFSRYKHILAKKTRSVLDSLPDYDVFYFDRLSRGALILAEYCKSHEGLVVFEPSFVGKAHLFEEALAVSDIVKFADDRLGERSRSIAEKANGLVIETKGNEGFRYTFARTDSDWTRLPAHSISEIKDAAGAGDWFTAGLIDKLGRDAPTSFLEASESHIAEALSYGQQLASESCAFVGPRGLMYSDASTVEANSRLPEADLSLCSSLSMKAKNTPKPDSIPETELCPVCS